MISGKQLLLIFALLAATAGLQCRTTSATSREIRIYKGIYIDQFKFRYFKQALLESYNQSAAIREVLRQDHSGFTEGIITVADNILIDSLAKDLNRQLIADSLIGYMRAEGSDGKRPFDFILERYKSKWLDSLAKKRYKQSGVKKMVKEWYQTP